MTFPLPSTRRGCVVTQHLSKGNTCFRQDNRPERLCDVIDDVLNLMAKQGGARGLALLKSYIPTFTPNKPAVPR